jgi:membrane-associated phospholipid phosphatase
MTLVLRMRMWKYLLVLAVPYLFLCMSTVYIQAHYAIDAIAGFFVGIALFFLLGGMKLKQI